MLKFSLGNSKVSRSTAIFDLPAGFTCPFAHLCQAFADPVTGKITDGEHQQYRCYAASTESRYKSVRDKRWHNYNQLNGLDRKGMADLIFMAIVANEYDLLKYIRIHSSGDFFSQQYFDAWTDVARRLPGVIFYAYTKSLPFWQRRSGDIPENFVLTASEGGKKDALIDRHGLRSAKVVLYKQDADAAGLEIDHDDSLARTPGRSFALLIHGSQPAGSDAAYAVVYNKQVEGFIGYGKSSQRVRNGNAIALWDYTQQ